MSPGWAAGVGELTAKVLIPVLLFNGAYKSGLPAAVSWQALIAFYLPLTALFALVAHGVRRHADSGTRALAACYSNTVFVGIPVLVQTLGGDSLQFAFPVIAFHSLVAFTLYYLAASGGSGGGRQIGTALANAARNPIVMSLMAGLVFNLAGVTLPTRASAMLTMVGSAALPCALLALGASLATLTLHSRAEAALVIAIKLLLFPALVLALAVYAFGLPLPVASVLVILASCPVGVNAYAVVQGNGKDPALVSSAILLSSVGCMATMPLWLWVLGRL
jgi:malonate transporter